MMIRNVLRQARLKIYLHLVRLSWTALLVSLILLFSISWAGLCLFEPEGSELTNPSIFWWFYYVTGTTTGYGDYSPQSLGGRIVTSVFVMTGGIALVSAFIGKIVENMNDFGKKRMQGEANYSRLSDHCVIIGWHPERGRKILDHILEDEKRQDDGAIVLCADILPENPDPENVYFVKGEKLGSSDVLERGAVAKARRIIIDCMTDDQTLAVGIAVSSIAKEAHIVAYFNSADYADLLEAHNSDIESIVSVSAALISRAALDRGSSRLHEEMLSGNRGPTQFRLRAPESFEGLPYFQLFTLFKQRYNATLLGVAQERTGDDLNLNTANDHVVEGGTFLYFMAAKRLRGKDIDWKALMKG